MFPMAVRERRASERERERVKKKRECVKERKRSDAKRETRRLFVICTYDSYEEHYAGERRRNSKPNLSPRRRWRRRGWASSRRRVISSAMPKHRHTYSPGFVSTAQPRLRYTATTPFPIPIPAAILRHDVSRRTRRHRRRARLRPNGAVATRHSPPTQPIEGASRPTRLTNLKSLVPRGLIFWTLDESSKVIAQCGLISLSFYMFFSG